MFFYFCFHFSGENQFGRADCFRPRRRSHRGRHPQNVPPWTSGTCHDLRSLQRSCQLWGNREMKAFSALFTVSQNGLITDYIDWHIIFNWAFIYRQWLIIFFCFFRTCQRRRETNTWSKLSADFRNRITQCSDIWSSFFH